MGDRHVTTDVRAGTCRCGCGRPLPPPPAGGGRRPDYASRACRQRAFRTRTATRRPADDPTSVAGLLAAIRDLAGDLDADRPASPGRVAAVREGAAALLARAEATPTGRHETTAAPGAVPTSDRHVTTDTEAAPARPAPRDPGRPAGRDGTSPTTPRRRRAVTGAGGGAFAPELTAAIRAAAALGEDTPTLRRAGSGEWDVYADGVRLGTLRPYHNPRALHARGWQAVPAGSAVPEHDHWPTRERAAAGLLGALQRLGRAQQARAGLRRPPAIDPPYDPEESQ